MTTGTNLLQQDTPEADREFTISYFPSTKSTQPRQVTAPWGKLVWRLILENGKQREVASKEKAGLISPAIYPKGATRSNVNVEALSMFALDVDNKDAGTDYPPVTLDETESLLRSRGVTSLIATTFSHSATMPKFRVIIPLVEHVPASNWSGVVKRVITHLGLEAILRGVDKTCLKDPARMYYLPSCPPGGRVEAREIQGEFLRVPLEALQDAPPEVLQPAQVTPTVLDASVPEEQVRRAFHGYRGDFKTLDMVKLWKSLGLKVYGFAQEGSFQKVECPWADEHTDPTARDAGFIHKANEYPGFHCFHDSCKVRDLFAVIEKAGPEKIDACCSVGYAPSKKDGVRCDLPSITIDDDLNQMVEAGLDALKCMGNVYQASKGLVEIVTRSGDGVPEHQRIAAIRPITEARAQELLSKAARWVSVDKFGNADYSWPPKAVVRAIQARPKFDQLPFLRKLITIPVLKADGEVITSAGYDPQSGIFFQPDGVLPDVPLHPMIDDANEAVRLLRECVQDFPFDGPRDMAAFLGALLTPFAVEAFKGPRPFFLINANTPGTGKSLLADVIGWIFTGRSLPRITPDSSKEEEKKVLTGIIQEGQAITLIDNIVDPFGSSTLAAVLTSETYKGRILGSTGNVEMENTTTWVGTGNNVPLVRDLPRRTVIIQLTSMVEAPQLRSDFRHPDLCGWVLKNREGLVKACLVILRGYIAAGSPDQQLHSFGSFQGWSNLVRSSIHWATGIDLCSAPSSILDPDGEALGIVMEAWRRAFTDDKAHLLSEFAKLLFADEGLLDFCRDALNHFECLDSSGRDLDLQRLGRQVMTRNAERVVNGCRFARGRAANQGIRWMLQRVEEKQLVEAYALGEEDGGAEGGGGGDSIQCNSGEASVEDEDDEIPPRRTPIRNTTFITSTTSDDDPARILNPEEVAALLGATITRFTPIPDDQAS